MTVGEKRNELISHCKSTTLCFRCPLNKPCVQISGLTIPHEMSDEQIETLYNEYEKMKGETTMSESILNVTKAEEKTITIAVSEYRFLISEQSTLSKLEGYAETHEYLSDDVVRALLGVEKPSPARIESEGD